MLNVYCIVSELDNLRHINTIKTSTQHWLPASLSNSQFVLVRCRAQCLTSSRDVSLPLRDLDLVHSCGAAEVSDQRSEVGQ